MKTDESEAVELILSTIHQTQIMLDIIFEDLYKMSPIFVSTYILNRVQWIQDKTHSEKIADILDE